MQSARSPSLISRLTSHLGILSVFAPACPFGVTVARRSIAEFAATTSDNCTRLIFLPTCGIGAPIAMSYEASLGRLGCILTGHVAVPVPILVPSLSTSLTVLSLACSPLLPLLLAPQHPAPVAGASASEASEASAVETAASALVLPLALAPLLALALSVLLYLLLGVLPGLLGHGSFAARSSPHRGDPCGKCMTTHLCS